MNGMARVNLSLPEDIHRLVRAAAALEGETQLKWIPAALEAQARKVLEAHGMVVPDDDGPR